VVAVVAIYLVVAVVAVVSRLAIYQFLQEQLTQLQ
jgi:hypothetical protein